MRYLMLFFVTILLIVSYYFYYKKNRKMYILFIILSAALLILYSTFRAYIGGNVYVGNDYKSYNDWFNIIQTINILKINDFLFNILMYVIKVLTNNYLIFILITSLLLVTSVYTFSIKNTDSSKYPYYVWAIFTFLTFGIYELSMSSIRQWVAGSIFLLAFRHVREKEFLKYLILIIIASLFHSSAIFLIIVYPFTNIKLDLKKKITIISLLTILLSVITYFKLDYKIISLFDSRFMYKYPIELQNSLHSNYTVFIISMCCLTCILLFLKKYKSIDIYSNVNISYLLLLVSISFVATTSSLFCRLLQYFMPAMMLIIPNIINIFNKKYRIVATCGALIVLILIYIM